MNNKLTIAALAVMIPLATGTARGERYQAAVYYQNLRSCVIDAPECTPEIREGLGAVERLCSRLGELYGGHMSISECLPLVEESEDRAAEKQRNDEKAGIAPAPAAAPPASAPAPAARGELPQKDWRVSKPANDWKVSR
jgi:hypothetical protein